jgi:hypothetical protein
VKTSLYCVSILSMGLILKLKLSVNKEQPVTNAIKQNPSEVI